MTVIAACVHQGQAVMGADTASFQDGRVWHDGQKIFQLNTAGGEHLTFGFAGATAIGAIVRRNLKIKGVPKHGEEAERDWLYAIAEAICCMVVDAKPSPLDDGGYLDGACLVLFRGRLWLLAQQSVGCIRDGYSAIGSGGDIALGALAALQGTDVAAADRVRQAISIAESHCDAVRTINGEPQLLVEHLSE